MGYDDPAGPNSFRYTVGWDLNSNGDPAYFSVPFQIPGVNDVAADAGMALADIDKNGILDLVLMAIDPGDPSDPSKPYHGRYKIGFNLSPSSGYPTSWTSGYKIFPGTGGLATGGSLEISNLQNTSQLWFTVSYYDDPAGDNNFRTVIAPVDNQGNLTIPPTIGIEEHFLGVSGTAQGAGVAIGDIDRNGTKDFIQMAYDNPVGNNTFRYYFEFNIQIDIPAQNYFFQSCTCN